MAFNLKLQFYRNKPKGFVLIAFLLLFLSSCVTSKKSTYLQEYNRSDYSRLPDAPSEYQIQPNDNLFIRVTTPDPSRSDMFNTFPSSGGISVGEQAVDLLSYQVELDGTVELPYVGPVKVVGLNVQEAKAKIKLALDDYLTDAAVTVKLVNNYVSIMGEVQRPGRYPIYKGQLNIFQALAMAGDMSNYGDRYRVNLIRQTANATITKEFDLTDKNIIDTEYFYVLPNDVIYVQPMKGKFWGMEEFPFMLILTSITTFILVLNYIENP